MIKQGDCTLLYGRDVLDALRDLPDCSVQCCVTSPPYWGLRDYKADGQLGLERTPQEYVAKMREVFDEVRRVLRDDGTMWLNLGDSYASSGNKKNNNGSGASTLNSNPANSVSMKNIDIHIDCGLTDKNLVGIPWRVAFALQDAGWILRSDIIWAKPNPMPESVKDRPTKAHEYVFLFAKQQRYYYDQDAIAEKGLIYDSDDIDTWEKRKARGHTTNTEDHTQNGLTWGTFGNNNGMRNARSVWTIATQPYSEAHFATFPEALPKKCILAGSKHGDVILDPFSGSATTGKVALELGRKYIGIDLNADYLPMAERRLSKSQTIAMQL